jgi:TrmH family RNA methyltransferase
MISSIHNPKVKEIRHLQESSRARKTAGVFVVEGVRLVEEALVTGWLAEIVLFTNDLSSRGKEVLQVFAAQGAVVEEVTSSVMNSVSDTDSPQGILAVIKMRSLSNPQVADFIFIPDMLRDPGNLGSILRSATAAGVQAIWIPPGTVDPFSPKVLRSAMGAHFRLPIVMLDWTEIQSLLETHALTLYLASVDAGIAYTKVNFCQPVCLVVGGEAEGASFEAQNLAEQQVYIPMPGKTESLNAAAAAAILFFEVVRQRNS